MRIPRIFPVLFILVLVQLIPVYVCFATPSSDFCQRDSDVFDDWGVCRTTAWDEDGWYQLKITETREGVFVELGQPLIAFESLGEYADIAYQWGEGFVDEYPDPYQRAERIFYAVRDKIDYTRDSEQFDYGDLAHNADEVANTISEEGIAYNDCEEYAFLLAVMYQGAGYRSGVALMHDGEGGHAAPFVYLPGYEKAIDWTLNGEPGWVWAEATGKNNPFGGAPMDYFRRCKSNGFFDWREVVYTPGYIPRGQPCGQRPAIAWSPPSFSFRAIEGEADPEDKTLEVWNSGGGTLNWSVTDDATWLTLSPTSGTSTGEIDDVLLSVDISGMPAGRHSAIVTISAPGATNSPQTVSVGLHVARPGEEPPTGEPTIAWSPTSFIFRATEGKANPGDQTLEVWNSGDGTFSWSVSADATWLTTKPTRGTCTGETDEVTLSVDISGMRAGSYRASVTISAPGATNSPQTFSVDLSVSPEVGPPPPRPPWKWIVLFLGVVGLMGGIVLISLTVRGRA